MSDHLKASPIITSGGHVSLQPLLGEKRSLPLGFVLKESYWEDGGWVLSAFSVPAQVPRGSCCFVCEHKHVCS